MAGGLLTIILLLFSHIIPACCRAAAVGLSCPEHQLTFESSCYEFVGLQRSFFDAQSWCERGGGHLTFIQNDETQQFLKNHLQSEQNWWIGIAPSFHNSSVGSESTQGDLNWLDGSDVVYSNWLSGSVLDSGCGYISTDAGSHWRMASNCNQEFFFICEFELGRSLSCVNHSAVLQCTSDHVIQIDTSFYGRKTPHYCRRNISTSLTSLQQCSWDSVLHSVAGQCNGHQVCLAVTDTPSFEDACPTLGSYLLVEYSCKYRPSSMIVKQSADDEDHDEDSSVENTVTLRQDTQIRVKRKSQDSEEKQCSLASSTALPLTITCLNCDAEAVDDKIILEVQNQECKKIYWRLEDKTDTTSITSCQKIMKLVKKEDKSRTVGIKTKDLRSFQLDFLVEATCDNAGGSKMYGNYIITKSLLNLQTNSLMSMVSNQLIEMNSTDQVPQLRAQLLSNICMALSNSSLLELDKEVLMVANAIKNIVEEEGEVNSDAQEQGGCILKSVSESLAYINLTAANITELKEAAQLIVESASHVLAAFSSLKEKDISGYLINALDSVQSFLLANKEADLEPAIITAPHISIYANRLSPGNISQAFTIQNINSATFSLPSLGNDVLPSDTEPVDVRMTNFQIDPWIEGQPINGTVAGFSLTTKDGPTIPVKNLPQEIEILLPRPEVELNSTVLDLSSYSTMIINMTTLNTSLVLKLEPSEELSLLVLLGYESRPSDNNYIAKVTLPLAGSSLVERYTWVVTPSELQDVGVYYLLIRPIVSAGVKSVNASVTITTITAQCVFWKLQKTEWRDSDCRVGPNTTANVTQCLCTHLTFFGSSFFVMPNTVDPSQSAQLFSNFAQNPVVVCFIGAIFLAYILVAIWARWKDLKDKVKVKVTVLEDNDPFAEYRYLLKISTGHRIGSSTSSRVVVMIQGTEGECEPHHLTDSEKPVFERGAVDLFLLTTPYSLGQLQSIRLWHDNSGDHPAWYVNSVMVQDLETGQKWHFLCSSWLAADIDDCTVERTFPVATEMDMKGFSNLFFMKTTTDFCDGHIWYSVVSRPPSSSFTRVQRVSCCFSILLCSMLTSIMFYGVPTDPSEQSMDMGSIQLTWSQVIIGIQSSIIVFPVNLLIVGIFRNARPREKTIKPKRKKKTKTPQLEKETPAFSPHFEQNNVTVDFLIRDIQRIIYLFANAMRCSIPNLEKNPDEADIHKLLSELQNLIEQQHSTHRHQPSSAFWIYTHHLFKQVQNMEGEVRLLGPSGFLKSGSYSQVLLQVQKIKKLLESLLSSRPVNQHVYSSNSTKDKKKSSRRGLPWWFVYVGWLLVAATSVISGYFTMLYGLKYGKDLSISWIISIAMSFTESLFFTQPVKVLLFAIFFALVIKNVNSDDELVESLCKKASARTDGPDGLRLARRDCLRTYYQPPPPSDVEKMKRNLEKQRKARALVVEILVFMGFLWMLLMVVYGQRDSNAYYLTQHIRQSFARRISDSMTASDVFSWADNVLLNNLYGQQYPGFITDGNSKLVGGARLRQVRVKSDSCQIAKPVRHTVSDCNAPYSWENEDMDSYSPGWQQLSSVNGSVDTAWRYQSQSSLRGYPVWGNTALYRAGGYVVDLGFDHQNASSKLSYLSDSTWLDTFTRAVFVEFTVYNANVNLFCVVTLMLERTAVGAFDYHGVVQSIRVYQSTGGFQSFLVATQVFYFLFVLYYMFLQGKLMKRQKWGYFKNKWNLLDLSIIILSWTTLSAIIKRTVLGDKDITYYQKHKDQFPSFHDTAVADATLGYLMAFLVLLASIKLWHLLRLNPKLRLITSSLQRAWNDMSSFTLVIIIIFLAYSLTCYLIFGWKLYSYRTLTDAFKTIFNLQFGIFNYDEVLDSDPVLGALVVSSCVIFLTFVILTLFVSVILEAFSEEQENHQPSEEEEYVDLILLKTLSLFGIKRKKNAEDKQSLLSDDTN